MACRGTCTVRIFEARAVKAGHWPAHIDEKTALRVVQGGVDEETAPFKESGCEAGECKCVPMADYMPDAAGKRKKQPDWDSWEEMEIIENIGSGTDIELVVGTVQLRSAIIPGLCRKGRHVHIHWNKPPSGSKAGAPPPDNAGPKKR